MGAPRYTVRQHPRAGWILLCYAADGELVRESLHAARSVPGYYSPCDELDALEAGAFWLSSIPAGGSYCVEKCGTETTYTALVEVPA